MFYFYKMQAAGNDFIIINNINSILTYNYSLLSKYLCDRHLGVGADGVLILEKSTVADIKFRIFNKDGSEAEMCGNGIRCIARFVFDKKIVSKTCIYIETKAGIKKTNINNKYGSVIGVDVNMGKAYYKKEDIPVFYNDVYEERLVIDDKVFFPVQVGNPHCVCVVENVDEIDISKIGNKVENYKYFPNRINVEFIEKINEDTIKVRIWERGVGETNSCGTGVTASAAIFMKYFSTKSLLNVESKGGILKVFKENDDYILSGNAEYVFEGKI